MSSEIAKSNAHAVPASIANQYRAACLAVFFALTGCGGSADLPPAAPAQTQPPSLTQPPPFTCAAPTEGLPQAVPAVAGGNIVGRQDPSFIFVARGDGKSPLLFYGPDLATTSRLTGFIYAGYNGVWCSSPDRTPYNGLDRGERSISSVYLYTTITPSAPSLSGTIRYASATYSLAGGPVPGSNYNATAIARISDVAGAWTTTNLSGAQATLFVDANGAVSGTDAGCRQLAGAITPSQDGPNLFDLRLTVSWCQARPSLSQTYEGFVIALPLVGGGTQMLMYADANNGVDFDFVAAIGRR